MSNKTKAATPSFPEVLDHLSSLGVQDLLRLKQTMATINTLLFTHLDTRLTELVGAMLHQPVNMLWEDVSLLSSGEQVLVVGLRTFRDGETVEYGGDTIDITGENEDVIGMKIRLILRMSSIHMLLDPAIAIADVIADLDKPDKAEEIDEIRAASAVFAPTTLPPKEHPLEPLIVDQQLYALYNKSTTRH